MREKTYHIYLNEEERSRVIQSLIALKNNLDAYSRLTDGVEAALDEADQFAVENETRYTHEEVFENLRRKING